jgi:hypothetical protein
LFAFLWVGRVLGFFYGWPFPPPAAAGGTDTLFFNGFFKLSNFLVFYK